MSNVVLMTVLEGCHHLLEDPPRVPLTNLKRQWMNGTCNKVGTYASFAEINNVLKELFARVLHDHDYISRRRDDLVSMVRASSSVHMTHSLMI
jgi:hypothetical protein